MSNLNLHNLINSFLDVSLISLAAWPQANEIAPCDHGGHYMVTQEGYDPEDRKMTADEFVTGRSRKWLSPSLFFRLPMPDCRAGFVFGMAGEVMQLMESLTTKVIIVRPREKLPSAVAQPEPDETVVAFHAGNDQTDGVRN